jgi:hypothetical protein
MTKTFEMIDRQKVGAADGEAGLTESAQSALSELGFGGGFATNKKSGDMHFGTRCSHQTLLARIVFTDIDDQWPTVRFIGHVIWDNAVDVQTCYLVNRDSCQILSQSL